MIEISIDPHKLDEFNKAIRAAGRSVDREMAAAFNKVATQTRKAISMQIREELATTAGAVNKQVTIEKRASKVSLSAEVRLSKVGRVALKEFKPRQNGGGVTYRISKRGKRGFAAGAFMGPKPGVLAPALNGHVFKRQGAKRRMKSGSYAGKMRQPIVKLMGASPWAVFVKQNMTPEQVKAIESRLEKEMTRRIRENVMRANGLIKN